MIYYFSILNDDGKPKYFYLTADDQKSLVRRVIDTYRVPGDRINILHWYEEDNNYNYINKKIFPGDGPSKVSKRDQKNNEKANELYFQASKKRGDKKLEYIKKYNFKEIQLSGVSDLVPLLSKYKKVKCYWQPGEKRGEHQYYALVK